MAQRHPTFFDGIISGAPAMRTAYSGIGDEWVATMLNTAAPKDASGKVDPRAALSDAQKKAVIDGVLNACDAGDGLKDDMIFNTKACRFDPKTLVCGANKTDACLTMAQATAIEKGFAGPKDSKGRQVYPGFMFDTGIASTQGIPGLLHGGLNPVGPAVLCHHAWTSMRAPRPRRPAPVTCSPRRRAGRISTRSRTTAAS